MISPVFDYEVDYHYGSGTDPAKHDGYDNDFAYCFAYLVPSVLAQNRLHDRFRAGRVVAAISAGIGSGSLCMSVCTHPPRSKS